MRFGAQSILLNGVLLALAAAPAHATEALKDLPGARLGCAHVFLDPSQADPKAGAESPKNETLADRIAILKKHSLAYCGQNGQAPAAFTQVTQAYTGCGTNAEDPKVTTLGSQHDQRRQALCSTLGDYLKQADAFCKYYAYQEKLIRLTIGMVNDPVNKDAWTADLRLKYLADHTKGGVKTMQNVQQKAKDAADFGDANPKISPNGISPTANAIAQTAQQLSQQAQAAGKAIKWKYPLLDTKIVACKAVPGCGNGATGQLLKAKHDQFKAAQSNCNSADLTAKFAADSAKFLADDADKMKKGLLSAIATAKNQEAMMADQQKRVADYLSRMTSAGPIAKPNFLPPAHDKPDITGLQKVGSLKPTFYWDANEENLGEEKTHAVLAHDGTVLAHVSERFYTDELAMEGTGRLADGRMLNAAGKVNGQQTFEVIPSDSFGYGVRPDLPLVPFQSVAVDPKQIPIGSVLYVPPSP